MVLTIFIGGCEINLTDYLKTQNYIHDLNKEGKIFSVQKYNSNVGNGENRTLIIKTNSKEVHLLEFVLTGSDSPQDLILYENVTTTNLGTEVDIKTRNRKANTNSSTLVYSEATISDYGELLDRDLLTASKREGGQVRRVPYEWILKSNTTYAIVTINRGGVEEQILNVVWYEREK